MIRGFRDRLTAKHGDLIKHAMGLLDGWMPLNDPPARTRLRDPVRRSFSPAVVKKLIPRIEAQVTFDCLLQRSSNIGLSDHAYEWGPAVLRESVDGKSGSGRVGLEFYLYWNTDL